MPSGEDTPFLALAATVVAGRGEGGFVDKHTKPIQNRSTEGESSTPMPSSGTFGRRDAVFKRIDETLGLQPFDSHTVLGEPKLSNLKISHRAFYSKPECWRVMSLD